MGEAVCGFVVLMDGQSGQAQKPDRGDEAVVEECKSLK